MTSVRYPSLRIQFTIGTYDGAATALLDTGCDADLVVPISLGRDLPTSNERVSVETASGERDRTLAYRGMLELVEQPGTFPVWIIALGDEYLLGLPALNRFRVTLDHGERLTIDC